MEDIQYLCDVHVAMFRESLDGQTTPGDAARAPCVYIPAENELAAIVLNDTRQTLRPTSGNRQQD